MIEAGPHTFGQAKAGPICPDAMRKSFVPARRHPVGTGGLGSGAPNERRCLRRCNPGASQTVKSGPRGNYVPRGWHRLLLPLGRLGPLVFASLGWSSLLPVR